MLAVTSGPCQLSWQPPLKHKRAGQFQGPPLSQKGKSPSLLPERLWHHHRIGGGGPGGKVGMILWKERQPPSTCPHRLPVSDWPGSRIKTTTKKTFVCAHTHAHTPWSLSQDSPAVTTAIRTLAHPWQPPLCGQTRIRGQRAAMEAGRKYTAQACLLIRHQK